MATMFRLSQTCVAKTLRRLSLRYMEFNQVNWQLIMQILTAKSRTRSDLTRTGFPRTSQT